MAGDDWSGAAARARQDEIEEEQAQHHQRRFHRPNLEYAAQVDIVVNEFLGVVRTYHGSQLKARMEAVQSTGKPTGTVMENIAKGSVHIVVYGGHVEWRFSNPDMPENADFIVDSLGLWRFCEFLDRSSGGVTPRLKFGYDDNNQLQVPASEPLDERYLSEAMQSMAAFLQAVGLPLPQR